MDEFNRQYVRPIKANYGMFHDANGNHILDVVCKFPEDKVITDFLLDVLNEKETNVKVTKTVNYKPTKISTPDGIHLISVRGWGRFKYLPNGAEIQDRIGNEIAELINSFCVPNAN